VLVSKNALCWLFTQNHSKTALCLCLKTLCAGFLLKITLNKMCAVAAQSCLGRFFVLGHRQRRKDCPLFRTPHLHTVGNVNDLFCRVFISVVGSKFACVPVGAGYETLCAVLPQVQHDGGLLELFLEFIAVPVLGLSGCEKTG